MLQAVHYGFWEDWLNPQKVTFDGINKLILINHGETYVDVKVDVYSAWKEWMLSSEHDNAAYLPAMRSVGGDPTVGGAFLGSTFFLSNGWRMRTWEGDHRLTLVGNIYTEEGLPPFVPTILNHNIIIEYQVSSLVSVAPAPAGTIPPTTAEITTAVWSSPDIPIQAVIDGVWASPDVPIAPTADQIAFAVWEEAMAEHSTPDSVGKRLKELLPTLWGIK